MGEEKEKKNNGSIAAYRDEPNAVIRWTKQHMPWLYDTRSLFFFVIFLLLLSMAWTGWSLINNHFTQLYAWDYEHQFVTFYYNYWDIWREFFQTGEFRLYNHQTFLGVDNIGSNAYYGLFDPFVVVMVFFPRSWIPQMVAITTFAKLIVTALFARMYLKYMGIEEWIARTGAVAIAFSGFMNYMVGFQNVVSAIVWFPLVLVGIEKVIRERKPTCLVLGLAFMGITNFFYLVPTCIWGVIYAVWRYFQTFKQRTGKENVQAILVGVGSFAVGLMMCAWVLLPSMRVSATSGRTTSIGRAYLDTLLASFKDLDFETFIGLLFTPVGESTGRELMALVSFFYPTGGYLYLPLTMSVNSSGGTSYDAWTASIFPYTIFVILFFAAIIHSIRKKKWSHLVAIVLCTYLLFTTFAYYFSFAFSGNGYGRWFYVLIPEIVFYGCWVLNERKEESRWTFVAATVLAFIGTLGTYFLTDYLLNGKVFSNSNGMTYWQSYYAPVDVTEFADRVLKDRKWYIYYQLALVLAEGGVLIVGRTKQWLKYPLLAFVSVEAVVMGNVSFVYGASKSYSSFLGGPTTYQQATQVANLIEQNDNDTFYRTYLDSYADSKNVAMAYGYNSTSSFHSLLNFEAMELDTMLRFSSYGYASTTYGGARTYNYSWSGSYNNKRHGTDALLGVKYYVVKNDGYGDWQSKNVPFGSVEVEEMSTGNYTVYRNDSTPTLGHAVNKDYLYYLTRDEDNPEGRNAFRQASNGGYGAIQETMRNEDIMSIGAIIDDEETLPEGFEIKSGDEAVSYLGSRYTNRLLGSSDFDATLYTTTSPDLFLPSTEEYKDLGPTYIFDEEYQTEMLANGKMTIDEVDFYAGDGVEVPRDTGHLVISSTNADGYFNDDPEGCYITFYYPSDEVMRMMVVGDKGYYDENGEFVVEEENTMLSFEWHAFDMTPDADVSWKGSYGIYAEGRVKYLVFEPNGPTGSTLTFTDSAKFYIQERHEEYSDYDYSNTSFKVGDSIEALSEQLQEEYWLNNVNKDGENAFTFDTDYEEQELVVTQIAYDDGWKIYANGEEIETYKLNGGLVGFVAPPGEVSYSMVYETPYLKEGLIIASIGTFIYGTYICYDFIRQTRYLKKSKELGSRDDKGDA